MEEIRQNWVISEELVIEGLVKLNVVHTYKCNTVETGEAGGSRVEG